VQKCEGLEEPRKRLKENQQQEKENEAQEKVKLEKLQDVLIQKPKEEGG
tara:strand:+ start:156 stop:302 length:147 start_codon:yes stop_codon:yes gene_type:complete